MAANQVDFTGLENVTYKKGIIYDIVICWYAELAKYVDCCSVSLHNLFRQSCCYFHTTW